MNIHYGHNSSPPRRVGQRTRLTPSTVLSTPVKTPSSQAPYSRRGPSRHNVTPCRLLSSSPSLRKIRKHTPSTLSRQTPYFTPSQFGSPDHITNDRFIPSRQHMNMDLCRRSLLLNTAEKKRVLDTNETEETDLQKEFKRRMLSTMCNIPLHRVTNDAQPTGILSFGGGDRQHQMENPSYGSNSMRMSSSNPFALDMLRAMKIGSDTAIDSTYQNSAVAGKALRKVPSAPVRILDAPDIVDDYYLNLISWSKDNILAVALARSVYLWNATSGDIHHLISVPGTDYITSVSWSTEPGHTKFIAVGTYFNEVHLFDGQALRKVRTMKGANGRIASLAWSQQFLSAGDRDGVIINHDVRSEQHIVSKYKGHVQEVCGLKWNDDGSCLASGGNENYLCLWDAAMSGRNGYGEQRNSRHAPRQTLKDHKAAVKALDWCPFHRGLLASGGGTADRSIKFWNTSSGALLNSIDTGSQVCSIIWSKTQRELCSSHGYSQNQLILWKYPSMTKIKELTGHTARVLNMDISPDGTSIVSAGADETLRFWNVFGAASTRSSGDLSELALGGRTIR